MNALFQYLEYLYYYCYYDYLVVHFIRSYIINALLYTCKCWADGTIRLIVGIFIADLLVMVGEVVDTVIDFLTPDMTDVIKQNTAHGWP